MKNIFRILFLILAISLIFTLISCNDNQGNSEDDGDEPEEITTVAEEDFGDNLHWLLDSEGTLTISGNGEFPDYSYDIIGGNTLKTPWDSSKTQIKKVVIEEGITNIGNYAFYGCYSLANVTIPRGITKIGSYSFFNTKLERVALPYTLTAIGEGAFSTNSLVEATIPYNVSELGRNAFLSNNLQSYNVAENSNYFSVKDGVLYNYLGTKLIAYPAAKADKTFVMPEEVTSVSFNAFFECNNLTSIIVSPNLIELEDGAFRACRNITSLSIPDGVTSLGADTFDGCSSLTSINIGSGITFFSGTTFGSCQLVEVNVSNDNNHYKSIDGIVFTKDGTSIVYYPCSRTATSYTIPDGITKIGPGCFSTAKHLQEIKIPDSVTEIGYCAFEWSPISSIYLPLSVKKIEFSAFSECKSFTDVYYAGTAADWIKIEIGEWNSILLQATRHYNSSNN